MTVTKRELVQAVVEHTGCQRTLAAEMVDSLFQAMREQLIAGNRIEVRGFGALAVKATKAKPAARNPRTGEIIHVPPGRKTHFKPGRLLRQALRGQKNDSDNLE